MQHVYITSNVECGIWLFVCANRRLIICPNILTTYSNKIKKRTFVHDSLKPHHLSRSNFLPFYFLNTQTNGDILECLSTYLSDIGWLFLVFFNIWGLDMFDDSFYRIFVVFSHLRCWVQGCQRWRGWCFRWLTAMVFINGGDDSLRLMVLFLDNFMVVEGGSWWYA